MNRVIKYLILYDYRKLNYKIIAIFSFILIIFAIYAGKYYIYLNRQNISSSNMWDLYSFTFVDSNILVSVLTFLSLYFTLNSFDNSTKDIFLKIRVNNLFTWFTSKIMSIFIFNFIIIILATIISLAVGAVILGFGINWSHCASFRAYSRFYTPLKFALINSLTYSFFVTFLSEILGVIIIKVKNKKIAALISLIYIVADRYSPLLGNKIIDVLKFLSLNSYTSYGRNYYIPGQNYQYYNMTTKEGLIVPIILAIMAYCIIKYLYKVRKLRFIQL